MTYDPEKLRQLLLESSDDEEAPSEGATEKPVVPAISEQKAAPEVRDANRFVSEPDTMPVREVVKTESEPPTEAPRSVDPLRRVLENEERATVPDVTEPGTRQAGFAENDPEAGLPDIGTKEPEDSSATGVNVEIEKMRAEAMSKLASVPSARTAPPEIPKAEPAEPKKETVAPAQEYKPYRQPQASSTGTPGSKGGSQEAENPRPKIPNTREALKAGPAGDLTPLRDAFISGKHPEDVPEEPEPESPKVKGKSEATSKTKSGKGKGEAPKKKNRPVEKEIKPPSPLSGLMLVGGGIALIGATIAAMIGQAGPPVAGLGAIGILLAGGFAGINRRWMRRALSSRSARYSANVTVVILSLAGILVFVNIIAYRYHYRIDMSASGVHSLSPQTLNVLEEINRAGEDITVTAFTPPDSGYRDKIEGLMDLYLYKSERLKFSFVDPDIQVELAESKGINRNPAILFEQGDKRVVVSDIDEPHFTSALLTMRQSQPRLVSFLGGHGEPDPFSEDGENSGLSILKGQLELEGYQANVLRIPAANGIPPETSLLIIASPQRDLEQLELDAVKNYLDSGGNVICFLEPGNDAGLGPILQEYGMAMESGIIADDQRNAYGELLSPIATGNPEHPVTRQLFEQELVFINAGSVAYTTSERLPGIVLEKLVSTWPSSWLETTGEIAFNDGVDTRESRDLAVLATRDLDPGSGPSEVEAAEQSDEDTLPAEGVEESIEPVEEEPAEPARIAQLLLVSDGSFAQNANIDRVYNRDFILNAVNYITAQHDLITIRSAGASEQPLELTSAQRTSVLIFSVILTPLLIAGLGGLVWWRRR